MKNLLFSVKPMIVAAERVHREEITQACHEGIGSVQEVRVFAS